MSLQLSNDHNFLSVQRLDANIQSSVRPVGQGMIEIYVLFSGDVRVVTSNTSVVMLTHTLYCLAADRTSELIVNGEADGYFFRFNEAMIHSSDKELSAVYLPAFKVLTWQRQVMKLNETALPGLRNMCEILLKESETESVFKSIVLRGYMNFFLFNLTRGLDLLDNGSGERSFVLIRHFNFLLEENFRNKKKVSDYASLLAVTPNYLNATIKRITGSCAGTHIRRRVIIEAVRKVNLTGASMKELAYELGFKDNSHFSKFFKKASGGNFSEFKKQSRGKLMVA